MILIESAGTKVNSFKLHVVSRSSYAKHARHVCMYVQYGVCMYVRMIHICTLCNVASENQESRWLGPRYFLCVWYLSYHT